MVVEDPVAAPKFEDSVTASAHVYRGGRVDFLWCVMMKRWISEVRANLDAAAAF